MSRAFEVAMARFAPALPLAVGFSGGADSTALLAACARRWPGQVAAVHVHHGLQAAADDFERHCAGLCRHLGVLLQVHRVDARAAPGESPEDAARRARYAVFSARPEPSVALGHHADDQVETLLLALSRGAGLPGLAAMSERLARGGVTLYRPLLAVPALQIRTWLRSQGLPWIEDPSNADARYTRNRIRAEVLPALERAFGPVQATFARSAAHAAQAQQLLTEIAAEDLAAAGDPPRIAALRQLSRPRRANLLRHWLAGQGEEARPSAVQLEALLDQIEACRTRGHRIHLKAGRGAVQRDGEVLHWYNLPPLPRVR
ncbi:MAG: tRNA lysidine(34) synthetase TilS [Xenophilus sp.]